MRGGASQPRFPRTLRNRLRSKHSFARMPTGVPRPYETSTLWDPTVGPCLGFYGGPKGGCVFLWARYSCTNTRWSGAGEVCLGGRGTRGCVSATVHRPKPKRKNAVVHITSFRTRRYPSISSPSPAPDYLSLVGMRANTRWSAGGFEYEAAHFSHGLSTARSPSGRTRLHIRFHVKKLIIYKLGFNQNYYTLTLL